MGLIDSTSITGLELLGFGKQNKVKQSNRIFPYEEGYITSSDVYAVTSKIAKGGKSIEWILEVEKEGKKEEVTSGALYDLIQNPNKEQTRQEFTEMALLYLLLSGEVFGIKNRILGFTEPTQLALLNPQLTTVKVKKIGAAYDIQNYMYDGSQTPIPIEIITFLKYANPTIEGTKGKRGLSPLVAGYMTLKGLNNNQEANASILENQGAAGILSNEGENVLTDDERAAQQTVLDKLIAGVRNFGKIIQSGAKVKFTRLGLDPTQLKIIESKLLKFRDLCAIYDVKSILFNDPVNAAFNNLTNAEKSYWINAAIPNTQLIVNMFTDAVVNDFNEKDFPNGNGKYTIRLAVEDIVPLQADKQKEAQKDKMKMEGVNLILLMPITVEGKIELLMSEYDYSEENAKIIAKERIDNGITD